MADLTSGFPKNLAYSIKELNGFSKQTVKILSDRLSSSANPNDIIRIKLPPNSIIDLRTFCLYFDFTATTSGTVAGCEAHFPRYSSSIIDQLNVYINNNQVSTIQYYNHLYNTIADLSYGGENTAKRSLENYDPSVIYKFDDTSAWGKITGYRSTKASGAGNDNTRTFCINNFMGIFQASTPCIDTSDCGDVIIEIRLANSGIVWGSAGTSNAVYFQGNCSYSINNIRATVSRISFNNSEYYELKAAKLLESSLLIGFQDFYTVRGNSTQKSANVSWTYSVNANSLDYIIATVQRADYTNNCYLALYGSQNDGTTNSDGGTIAAGFTNYTFNEALANQSLTFTAHASQLRDGDYFNQAIYFQRRNHGFKTGQFSINSVMIDTYPRPAEEVYTDTLINLGMKNLDTGSSIHPGCISLWHYNKYYWAQICSLQNISGDNQFWRSGLNGNAAAILVQYNAVYDGLASDSVYPVFFNALTKILSVSAGRVINIV